MTNQILFGIVTYKEKYWETETFLSLIKSYKFYDTFQETKLYITIVDNTDLTDWHINDAAPNFDDTDIKINYNHFQNPGLSYAYNFIGKYALENGFEWMVLLDQDTALPENFFKVYIDAAARKDFPLKVPLVYSEAGLMSPAKFINFRSRQLSNVKEAMALENISAINSGLMIKTDFFDKVRYNPSLKLDFCDHDFLLRAAQKIKYLETLKEVSLFQHFSAETHNEKQALRRFGVFKKDIKAFSEGRNKWKVLFFVVLPHALKLALKYKNPSFLKL